MRLLPVAGSGFPQFSPIEFDLWISRRVANTSAARPAGGRANRRLARRPISASATDMARLRGAIGTHQALRSLGQMVSGPDVSAVSPCSYAAAVVSRAGGRDVGARARR